MKKLSKIYRCIPIQIVRKVHKILPLYLTLYVDTTTRNIKKNK